MEYNHIEGDITGLYGESIEIMTCVNISMSPYNDMCRQLYLDGEDYDGLFKDMLALISVCGNIFVVMR